MKIVLFCGGLGMRLRDHAENVPKPSSVMTTLAAQKTEATRRRRVNRDCDVEFLFMWRLVWYRFLGQPPCESITFL